MFVITLKLVVSLGGGGRTTPSGLVTFLGLMFLELLWHLK